MNRAHCDDDPTPEIDYTNDNVAENGNKLSAPPPETEAIRTALHALIAGLSAEQLHALWDVLVLLRVLVLCCCGLAVV